MAYFFVPNATNLEFLLDVAESTMVFIHSQERKLPCEGLGPVFGTGKTCIYVLCPAWTEVCLQQVSSTPTAAMIAAVGLDAGLCQPVSLTGHKAKAVRRQLQRAQLSSSENLLSDTEAHVLSQVCSLCASALTVPSTRLCGLVDGAVHCFPSNR